MDIQLIALDLDRTTLNSQGKLSKTNYNALSQAIKNGVHVCIASGRAFDTLPSDVLSVPGIEYAITSNGAAVYNIKTKERIKSYLLTENAIDIIMNICKKYPVTYEAFINGVAYTGKEYIDNPDKFGATQHSIDKCGISAYPAAVENKAAPTDEEYAIVTAIRSSLDAFLPICVIEGAINAIIISGMQKLIIWLRIYFSVTTIFNMAFENALPSVELSTSPITTPARTLTISLNGRLFQKLVFFIK